ncbi:MAG TPA: glycosyltransferase family A protein, partial [Alphaproteobacteria bacterium]|nr:glycosyltransferase family A protein [Alphaproteobacteria bacterium]
MNVLVIEATHNIDDARACLQHVAASGHDGLVLLAGETDAMAGIAEAIRTSNTALRAKAASAADLTATLENLDARTPVAFLPRGAAFSQPEWSRVTRLPHSVMAWPIDKPLPEHSCSEPDSTIEGWVMSADLARLVLVGRPLSRWRLSMLGLALEEKAERVHWISSPNVAPALHAPAAAEPKVTRSARVVAIIPHFACERWLAAALTSLTRQTRAPDGIVVIDDASPEPPADICRRFPEVTLLRSTDNVGPYRLTQQVINDTGYDA